MRIYLPSRGCYQVFITEQFGYYCSFYSLGEVSDGTVIGAVWVNGDEGSTSVQTSSEPTSEPTFTPSMEPTVIETYYPSIMSGKANESPTLPQQEVLNFTISLTLNNINLIQLFSDKTSFSKIINILATELSISPADIHVAGYTAKSLGSIELSLIVSIIPKDYGYETGAQEAYKTITGKMSSLDYFSYHLIKHGDAFDEANIPLLPTFSEPIISYNIIPYIPDSNTLPEETGFSMSKNYFEDLETW
jgi:hypothetical protein